MADVLELYNSNTAVHIITLAVVFIGVGAGVPLLLMGGWRRPKNGVRGTAQVISVSGLRGNSSYAICYMNLVIEAPGVRPSAVEYRRLVSTALWPIPGTRLPIEVDPMKPERFNILWREVPTSASTAADLAEFVAAQLNSSGRDQSGWAVNAAQPFVVGKSSSSDIISQLERLAALRSSGVLTEDEYASERNRLLRESRDGS